MSWAEKTLDELGTISRGRSRHRPRDAAHLYGGDYPFIQTGDVKHAGLYLTNFEQTYSEAGLAQSKLWPEGTLCITIAANIADTSILKIKACFPDSVIGFIPDVEKADARFIKYLFDAMLKRKYKAFTQGAAQDNLSQEKLLSIKFPVPDITTQQNIAAVLATYDDLIENNKRRIELLEESSRQLYKEWFVRFRFPGHEHVKIIDGVPEGWEKANLLEVARPTYGFAFKSDLFSEEPRGLPIVRIRDVPYRESETYTTEETTEDKILTDGDFLIGMDGDFHMNYWAGGKAWLNQRVVMLEGKELLTTGFIKHAVEKPIKDFNETITGTTVRHLGAKHLKMINVIFPKGPLLDQANCFFEDIRNQVVLIAQQNRALNKARDLLLPKLMSGEIAV
ncbi:MAG: restriction endonuclease subunit S [Methylicorpusculum sp.]|uniref:restriction endonuclease subunit S n=1 Tax=Methylicorpusculum sp. TaxID=2713644 RepID=UPI0027257FC0|nr:restriction endonuclease subunit S [Methylicorpusculum sp.]MDO8941359.1 restriction endonuclease subunit S [Methylicorpusculum sp.]MDP2202896.1 restriction endonuclease subunit S [Methylicorpusculum sp.]